MSIFDEMNNPKTSSLAELAEAQKAEPAEPAAPEAAPEPAPVETVAETPQSEPVADAAPQETAPAPEERAPRNVPAAALAEERDKRRQVEDRLAQLQGQIEAMQRMVGPQGQPQAPQPPPQEDPPPNRDEDPLGYMAWQDRRVARLEQHTQAFMVQQRVQSDYQSDAMHFAQTQPDFPAAYQHLVNGRAAELKAQGWDDNSIRQRLQQEEFGVAIGALRAGKSPAQQIYELSKARGYAPRAAEAPPAQAKAPAPALDPALAEAKKRAATGIDEGGASPRAGSMSWDDIAKLTGAAFDSAFEKKAREEGRRSSLFRN